MLRRNFAFVSGHPLRQCGMFLGPSFITPGLYSGCLCQAAHDRPFGNSGWPKVNIGDRGCRHGFAIGNVGERRRAGTASARVLAHEHLPLVGAHYLTAPWEIATSTHYLERQLVKDALPKTRHWQDHLA